MNVTIYNEDCISGMAKLGEASVDLTVSSIPFGALFSYSGKTEDIGNNQDGIDLLGGQFGLHMRFVCEQLFRVMKPGCNVCIHIQQLLKYKVQHGSMGRRDFRSAVVEMFERAGFNWTGEFAISKNPQIIAQRQNLHCLMFSTGKRNARNLAPAVCDFVMIFQRPGDSVPCPALYDARENPNGWVTTEEWIRDAHGVWTDIRETDVLENWQRARDTDDEKHVCPLQLEVIRRLVRLYTNPGETVLDPFMGIGSTAWVAVEQGRGAIGFEIKESYHAIALKNVERARAHFAKKQGGLFEGGAFSRRDAGSLGGAEDNGTEKGTADERGNGDADNGNNGDEQQGPRKGAEAQSTEGNDGNGTTNITAKGAENAKNGTDEEGKGTGTEEGKENNS